MARTLTNVFWSTTQGQDLTSYCVVHDSITIHAILIACSVARCGLRSSPGRSIPVHCNGWPRLEYRACFPAKEPTMVVASVDVTQCFVCDEVSGMLHRSRLRY